MKYILVLTFILSFANFSYNQSTDLTSSDITIKCPSGDKYKCYTVKATGGIIRKGDGDVVVVY